MGTRRCCCGTSCQIGTDEFNRANENPVTGSWSEVSGDWEVNANELNSISDGPLITTLRQPAPVRTGKGYNTRIVVDLVIPASGNRTYGIITAYRGTGDYSWIKLEYNGATTELRPTFYSTPTTIVMDINTHPGTEIFNASPGTNFEVTICASNVEWTVANVSGVQWRSCFPGGLAALPTFPLGGVGFLMGRFDDWRYYIHWESQATCETCLCFCLNPSNVDDYKCIPNTLLITITQDGAGTEPCGCLDGLSLRMYLANPIALELPVTYPLTASPKKWFSDVFTCSGTDYWFILSCIFPGQMGLSLVVAGVVDPLDSSVQLTVAPQTPPNTTTCLPIVSVYTGAITSGITTCDIVSPPSTGQRRWACSICYAGTPPTITWTATVTEYPSLSPFMADFRWPTGNLIEEFVT